MNLNVVVALIAALIPMVVGFIWYHPSVFGNTWMKLTEVPEEKLKSGNMAVIFGVTYVFAFFLAVGLNFLVIHQFHIYSMFFHELAADNQTVKDMLAEVMELGANNHRSFGHGALHGVISSVVLALPVLGTNALFERKGWKYIMVNAGYWILTFAIMGGVICQFG